MKRFFSNLIPVAGIALAVLSSCQKKEVRPILIPGTSPQLTASSATLVLDSTKDTENAVTFSWPKVTYGYNADVTYTLQFDTPSDSFNNPTSVTVGINTLTLGYTTQAFNQLAYQTLGLPANTASPVVVRVKADILQNGVITAPSTVSSIYSNVFPMTVTPFKIVIIFPSLWVPGDYQGWNPAVAPTLASVHANNVYEGYVYFPPGGTFQFKYTPAPNWNSSYGWLSSTETNGSVTGTMSTTGGNLFVPASGYYLLTADLNPTPAVWGATLITTWGVIGSATPGGWNTDTPMTFDPTTDTWSVTVALVSTGQFKFRANNAWALNFGYDNGGLDYNGTNISVPIQGSGNYTITLDLTSAGNYTYRIKKD